MPIAETITEPIRDSVLGCVGNTPLVALNRLFPEAGIEVIAKLELMNPGGSMKDRPARHIIEAGLANGDIPPGAHLIESSSGNFGIALAIAARLHGLTFTCVVDPKTTTANIQIMRQLGARVEVVTDPDEMGGYLHTRIRRVRELLAHAPNGVWINQYANARNWESYYHGTGRELATELVRPPDYLFAAVSTTGSILGCARRLRERFADLRVVAVDAEGSIIFGAPPGPRHIPGIGSSRVPELFTPAEIDDVVHVGDAEATRACRRLLTTEGIFAGGSSGAVVAAIARTLPTLPRPCRVVAIFPDRGDRYLDMVYDDEWLARLDAHDHSQRHVQ
ncbi:MAG TPA: 2,3-diaminopropionate biosynthesis protein SbnA [Pseudonocardiaceae bacterium]|nr:2,3-diaminopropionate biosynthesis protein SbnA [Pseudonocardiaceae bacterium]